MIGLGTLINSLAILAGGLVGYLAGKLFHEEQQDALTKTCGISVLFIAIAGAMDEVLTRYGLANEIYDEPKERELLKHGFIDNYLTSPCSKECLEAVITFLGKYTV